MTLAENLLSARLALVDQFDATGLQWCKRNSDLADSALVEVFGDVCPEAAVCLAAVGGYGRRELGPHSDLDFVFLADKTDEEKNVRLLFRSLTALADEVGWDLDPALRYPSDAPGLDDKSRTAILDARFVAGPVEVFDRFQREFWGTFPTPQFLADKRRERLDLRKKLGSSPRRIEPNLKDGAGGLRDIHAASWFRKVLRADAIEGIEHQYDFMIAVRNALHIATGRKEDRLVRTRHAEVASLVELEPQAMFTKVFESLERFQEEWRKAIYLAQVSRIDLANHVVSESGSLVIESRATLSDAAEGVARAVDLDIRVPLATIPNVEVGDGPAAAEKMTSGAQYLRALDRSGVLSALIPQFEDSKHLIPDDSVHEFTVGEHTLIVIDKLDESRLSGTDSAAWSEADQRSIYLAAIIHDLGKADTSAPHAVTGEGIATDVGKRLSLEAHVVDNTAWLVREHLTLARIARTHDLQMPEAPLELARICGEQSRLAMLLLLTLADISAVSSEALSPHFEGSIRGLFEKTRAIIGVDDLAADPATYRNRALESMRRAPFEGNEWLETMPTHYLIGTQRDLFRVHAEYVVNARNGELTSVFENDANSQTTELTIACKDLPKPGLLSRILGVVYAYDLSVHGVRAASTSENEPIALDQITISYRGGLVPKGLSAALASSLRVCVSDEGKLHQLMRNHHKVPEQRQHFLTYRFIPGDLAVIEFETPVGRGMPFRVSKMLADFGWNVYVARVGQWAGRAVARFYLVNPGGPLTEEIVASAIESYRRG